MTNNSDRDQQIAENEFIFSAEFTIHIDAQQQLRAAYKAIKPETTVEISSRGTTKIELVDSRTLKLIFLAKDFTTLRAMVSSYLRWMDVATRSIATLTTP